MEYYHAIAYKLCHTNTGPPLSTLNPPAFGHAKTTVATGPCNIYIPAATSDPAIS
jgi:hypothetical protein